MNVDFKGSSLNIHKYQGGDNLFDRKYYSSIYHSFGSWVIAAGGNEKGVCVHEGGVYFGAITTLDDP